MSGLLVFGCWGSQVGMFLDAANSQGLTRVFFVLETMGSLLILKTNQTTPL